MAAHGTRGGRLGDGAFRGLSRASVCVLLVAARFRRPPRLIIYVEKESRVVFLQLLVCVFSPGVMPRHVHPLAVCSGSSLRRHVHPSPLPGGLARQWSEISQSAQERATQVQRDHRDSDEILY